MQKSHMKLAKSIRKFIRKEKMRFRREILDTKEREKLSSGLYKRFSKKPYEDKPNLQPSKK